MDLLTDAQLRAIMPALAPARRQKLLPFLAGALAEFSIATPARAAAFVAQLAHESGQLRYFEEIWGPTPAQLRYEPPSTLATKLGNTEPGDGFRFKGRGPIQITGRANYRRYGDLLGLDLIPSPPSAAAPEVGFRTAGVFWEKNGLNELADKATLAAFKAITKRINGGYNGQADRERFYAAARAALGVTLQSSERGVVPEAVPAGEPLDRGYEAIRLFRPRRRARKTVRGATATKRAVAKRARRRVQGSGFRDQKESDQRGARAGKKRAARASKKRGSQRGER
jgi:putative chitinase